LTGDWALAEDLVQTSLARAWPRWERIRRDDPEICAESGGATPTEAAAAAAPRYCLQVERDAGPSGTNGVPATVNVPATGGRPVLTLDDELAIRSTATGVVTRSIRCPEPAGWWVDETRIAAAHDRTFIVACVEQPAARNPGTNTTETVLFRLRLTAAGRPAAVSPVPGGATFPASLWTAWLPPPTAARSP
jgi:hypothetical protein